MADLPTIVPLNAYRGDTWGKQFRLSTSPTVPLDLTGATVESWAKERANHDDAIPLTITVTDAPHGTFMLTLPPDMEAGTFLYDVEVTTPDGAVTTWVRGLLTVVNDVTNNPEP